MGRGTTDEPAELRSVPSDVLEKYVRARLLAVAGNATVSQRLGVPAETIRQAFAYVLSDNVPLSRLSSSPNAAGPTHQLAFGHSCQNLGCNEPGCLLCAQNPNRRCSSNFSTKYLAGDVLKANCGASIKVQVIDRSTLEPAERDALADVNLEICIIDGKAYSALQSANREQDETEVEACILATNNQGKELLLPGRGSHQHNAEKWVIVALANGEAYLPDLTITGSSEALLSGQKPPFRLLVRAMNSDGTRAANIRFVVSDAFVVATPRVRTAAKAEIPHLDDHVSKLHSVGNMTQTKLQDIKAAAVAVGIHNLVVPYNTVTKVGQFKELVDIAEQDPRLCETLKKVLKLTRGWEIARDHARTAVVTDDKMRVWCPKTEDGKQSSMGLLFKGHLGSADLENPVALLRLKPATEGKQAVMEPVLTQKLPGSEREAVKKLQKEAIKCWWQDNHPGWSIWPIDSNQFLHEMSNVNNGILSAESLIGAHPAPGQGGESRPVTRAAALARQSAERISSSQTSSDRASQDNVGVISQEGSHQPSWAPGPFPDSTRPPRSHPPFPPAMPQFPAQPMQFTQGFDARSNTLTNEDLNYMRGESLKSMDHMSNANPQQPPAQAPDAPGSSFPALPGAFPDMDAWFHPSLAHPRQTQAMHASGNMENNMAWNPDPRIQGMDDAKGLSMPLQPGPGFSQAMDGGNTFSQGLGRNQMATHRSTPPGDHMGPFQQNLQQEQFLKPWRSEGMGGAGRSMNPGWQSAGGAHGMPASSQMMSNQQNPQYTQVSGVARKRTADLPTGFPDAKSSPLPSPFGMDLMQDMEIPVRPAGQVQQMMTSRLSSGMQPSSAKRPHLTPHELQEGLSHIFGRPLRTQEMSKLFPNFSGINSHTLAEIDLPSMPLAMQNLSMVMDSMLDHREHGAQLSAVTDADSADRSQQGGASCRDDTRNALPGLFQGMDFTYGDLSDAVDMAIKPPQERNQTLVEPKNSQILMEFMTSRLQNNDHGYGEGRPGGLVESGMLKEERLSGLDTMNDIQHALP